MFKITQLMSSRAGNPQHSQVTVLYRFPGSPTDLIWQGCLHQAYPTFLWLFEITAEKEYHLTVSDRKEKTLL